MIGGWSTTGIFLYQSGEPYTISSGARTSNATHNSTAIIVGPNNPGGDLHYNVPGIEGPVLYQTGGFITAPLNDPHLNCQNITGTQTYFCIPPPGRNGNGRNRAQGPNYWNLDSGLLKDFKLTERFNLQFRAEAFNVLNHPNFAAPNFLNDANNSIGTSSAGVIGSTSTSSRQIQLGVKLVW